MRRTGRGLDWESSGLVQRLGRDPDHIIAADLGITRSAVAHARRYRAIAAPPRSPNPKYVDGRGTKWTPEAIARLGIDSDTNIAADLGLDHATVAAYRERRGIAPAPRRPTTPMPSWLEVVRERLGMVPDRVLAEEVGVHPQRVSQARARRGIPALRSRKTKGYTHGRVHTANLPSGPNGAEMAAMLGGRLKDAAEAYARRTGVAVDVAWRLMVEATKSEADAEMPEED